MLSRDMTLYALLEDYPFLEEYLVEVHQAFARLARPGPRRAWARMVRLDELATAMNLPWQELLRTIQAEVRRVSGVAPSIAGDAVGTTPDPVVSEDLRRIMGEFERGASLKGLAGRLDALTRGLDDEAVSALAHGLEREQAAVDEAFMRTVRPAAGFRGDALPLHHGHPVSALRREGARLADVLAHIEEVVGGLGSPPKARRWAAARPVVTGLLGQLAELDRRARRLRLAWYPTLDSRGARSITAVVDGELGHAIAAVHRLAHAADRDDAATVAATASRGAELVRRALAVEEELLVPAALRALDDDDWETVAEQERAVGWALAPGQRRWDESSRASS